MAKNNKTLEREMFKNPSSVETEEIVKSNVDNLTVNSFATISGLKGMQFGKEIFVSLLKFEDLRRFLEVFPDVQRGANKRKIKSIKNYVITGIEDTDLMRFFSGITVTSRGHIFYDESRKSIAIDTNNSKLSVNDGQHRFLGVKLAIDELQSKVNKAMDGGKYDKYKMLLTSLQNMVIPLTIFNNISEVEEKQLFYDLNTLAQRPSRSATIRLAQSDLISKMAREVAYENDYLKRYGVEMNKSSIHKNNSNTVLLTTIYAMIKKFFHKELKANDNYVNKENFDELKEYINDTFNNIFSVLPKDLNIKGKYITDKSFALRGIASFIYECKHYNDFSDAKIYSAIQKVKWTYDVDYWSKFGGYKDENGHAILFYGTQGGEKAVYDACYSEFNK